MVAPGICALLKAASRPKLSALIAAATNLVNVNVVVLKQSSVGNTVVDNFQKHVGGQPGNRRCTL